MRRLAFALALGGLAAAQGEIKPFPKVDPYTKNDPGLIEKAGYVSLGPFRFGDDHTTEQVENTLGGIPLIWVETARFKLGSGLPECALSDDKRERERLKGELQRLQAKLSDVKTKPKKLDPWLRLHLFAQRLEELYADFQRQFELEDLDFPSAPPVPGKKQTGPYMGEGPYLGMPAKFTVLIFDKKSALGRYSTVYFGREVNVPQRHYFQKTGSLLFATAYEFLEGDYANDSALACDVLNGVLQNMANGYKGYRTLLPLWYSEGLSHWFRRRFDPRYHLFSGTDLTRIRTKDEEDWAPSVRARVEHEVFPKSADMLAWADPDALEWADQLVLWSRVDYLLQREDKAGKRLLDLLKEPLPDRGGTLEERMLERSRSAFRDATGQDPDEFDRAWCAWVAQNYPRK